MTKERETEEQWLSDFIGQAWIDAGIPPSEYRKRFAWIDLCESPIERRMLAGLMFCSFGYYDERNIVVAAAEASQIEDPDTAIIIPQFKIPGLNYRVDFLVVLSTHGLESRPPMFVVECDGHDFHERTKEQAQRDRKRDRDIQNAGYPILRFTGSEIWRDLEECMTQLDEFGCRILEKVWKQHGK